MEGTKCFLKKHTRVPQDKKSCPRHQSHETLRAVLAALLSGATAPMLHQHVHPLRAQACAAALPCSLSMTHTVDPSEDKGMSPALQGAILVPLFVSHVLWLSPQSVTTPAWRAAAGLTFGFDDLAGAGLLAWLAMTRARLLRGLADFRRAMQLPRCDRLTLLSTSATLLLAYLVSGHVGARSGRVLSHIPCSAASHHALQVRPLAPQLAPPLALPLAPPLAPPLAAHALAPTPPLAPPATPPPPRAQVLAGHLTWVLLAVRILGTRLEPFFGRGGWVVLRWRAAWVWWALGGYVFSVSGYNLVDLLNGALLPAGAPDAVAARLVDADGEAVARALGCLGPCVGRVARVALFEVRGGATPAQPARARA